MKNICRKYLQNHKDENQTDLPLVSGAVGYFSYEYGRKLMGVASGEKDIVSIPDAVLIFYDVYIIEDCQRKKDLSYCQWDQKHLLKSFCKRSGRGESRQRDQEKFPI